jgi:hypothetical protein
MAKTWVLDTETKGTGAHIAPLRRGRGATAAKLDLVQLHPPARAPDDAEQPAPDARRERRFKVVDVLSHERLADDVPARAAVDALAALRTPLDALVYMRDDKRDRWRLLSLGETKSLWELRARVRARSTADRAAKRARGRRRGAAPGQR